MVKLTVRLANREEAVFGAYLALQSVLSLLVIVGFYNFFRFQDIKILQGPDGEYALVIPPLVSLTIALVSIYGIYRTNKTSKRYYDKYVDRHIIEELDPDFPLTSATGQLAKKVDKLNEQINSLHFLILLVLGWSQLVLPVLLLILILSVISKYTDLLVVRGDIQPEALLLLILAIIPPTIIFGYMNMLFRTSREIQFYAKRLKSLDSLNED